MAQITSQQQTGSSLDQYAQIAAPQLGMTPDQYIQAYNQAAANPTEYGSHVQSNSRIHTFYFLLFSPDLPLGRALFPASPCGVDYLGFLINN